MKISAKEVAVSFKLEHHFIEHVLLEQVFKNTNQSLRVNDDGTGCNFLVLSKPKVIDTKNELVRVRLNTWARIGRPIGDKCFMLLDWRGKTDLYNTIKLSPNGRNLTVRVKESKLLNEQGSADQATNQLWQWFNNNVYPVINDVTIDLNEPLAQIKSFIPLFIPKTDQKTSLQLVNSFAVKNVAINQQGVLLSLHFDVPAVKTSDKTVPALSKDEISVLKQKLDALDGYITNTLKQFLTPDTPEHIRLSLLETLINLRYEIIDIAAHPQKQRPDPVKRLFIATWQQIAPLIREIAKLQPVDTISIELLTFIAANDVLTTIEEIGPALGLDVSVNGLRRLARMLNSDPKLDPINIGDEPIPNFFLQPKALSHTPPSPRSETNYPLLDFFIPSALAKVSVTLDKKLVDRLNTWVPKKNDMNIYLPMAEQILAHAIKQQLKQSDLDKKYHSIYRNLVYATAWQESCWRQYEVVKGQRWPIKSSSGDLGMMQINPIVWRGFYNIHNIKWDIVYNAETGANILMYYLQRYAIRNKEDQKTGKLENLARSAYSGYNGGPRQYARYRNKTAPKQIKLIDVNFFEKFLAIQHGDPMAVKQCYPGI